MLVSVSSGQPAERTSGRLIDTSDSKLNSMLTRQKQTTGTHAVPCESERQQTAVSYPLFHFVFFDHRVPHAAADADSGRK